ncbi:MAG: hypothetical protein SFV15_23335 [Polyangiaceae bacterium]|nr:hypothetical protein [Polyangiaceae bacterium]
MKRPVWHSMRWIVGFGLSALLWATAADAARAGKTPSAARRVSNSEVFVRLGGVRNGAKAASKSLDAAVRAATRERFSALPGVHVLADDSSSPQANGRPTVLVTAKVRDLSARRSGSDVFYSAEVEYTLHRMPEEAIAATLSGHASARGSVSDMKNPGRNSAIQASVLDAAVSSAIRRAAKALRAAAAH